LLDKYSGGEDAAPALLLAGEAFSDFHSQASARATLQKFEQQFTNSDLQPDVEFAIDRTYELDTNLLVAIAGYQSWLDSHPTNALVPQVLYSLGRANFSAGNEAAAFTVFTNFVARYPSDSLAPQAQYWIGDHYFRAGEFTGAETNYEAIFQTKAWQTSPLIYAAHYMAGRAAMGRQGFQDAPPTISRGCWTRPIARLTSPCKHASPTAPISCFSIRAIPTIPNPISKTPRTHSSRSSRCIPRTNTASVPGANWLIVPGNWAISTAPPTPMPRSWIPP
jgi:tetratricopeptide (TPR) repeat protein